MSKHAYLIESHNNRMQLEKLLHCLDYPENDIFVHIDAKSNEFENLSETCLLNFSKLVVIPSRTVYWGGYSQIEVEIDLIEFAIKTDNYNRLHLISGGDLPLKSQKYIHNYFDAHKDTEFVHYDYVNEPQTYKKRMAQYHILRDHIDRSQKFFCFVEKALIVFQRMIGINRIRNNRYDLQKGANWFSITGNCAKYIVEQKEWIEKNFKMTKCCDEVFLQTLVYNSEFRNHRYYDEIECRFGNLRYTDWKRGNPYTFKTEDFDMLMDNSHYLFARKFDEKIDSEIIEKIIEKITTGD